MKKSLVFLIFGAVLVMSGFGYCGNVASPYTVGTWQGFKTTAVSYTFDDGTAKQIPVAIPIFDQFGYKVTLFTVTSWVTDWTGLQAAANNGHEVASHTVHHSRLGSLSLADETYEYAASQQPIQTMTGQ
jgi:peptidoglycan/xylan/chitin deacetylase (PgdA/CDA1 family)